MNVAILGFGTIGSGVYEIITNRKSDVLKNTQVVKVLDLPRNKDKLDIIVCDIKDIVEDDNVDLVVETMGGLHPAYEFIMEAFKHKKHVVTANKAVVAAYLDEFLQAAHDNGVKFLFEASVGGGIPWLASISKARRIDNINYFYGIFNGTTNFILDYMNTQNKSFDEALKLAQQLGYAEANPSADIDGYDVSNKVVISSALSFDTYINMKEFPCYSMSKITFEDIEYLKAHGQMIKYIGEAKLQDNEYEAFVMPNIFAANSVEANIPTNFNIVTLNGNTIGDLKFYGQGAGMLPTANAIIQDIIDIQEDVKRATINVDTKTTYNNTLFDNQFLLRSVNKVESDLIESVEEFKGTYYMLTKAIKTNAFVELASSVLENDENALIAKVANF